MNGWEDYLGSGKILKQAISRYGRENFSREIIAEADTLEELNALEQHYINSYNACESKEFYNIAIGGTGGNTRLGYSEEEYAEYCKKFSRPPEENVMYGRKHSLVSKQKNGQKTIERFKDKSFREKHSNAVKNAMKKVPKDKLAFENRSKNKLIKCVLCDTEEYVYTSQQKFCSKCKNTYTKWQLEKLYKQSLENIC